MADNHFTDSKIIKNKIIIIIILFEIVLKKKFEEKGKGSSYARRKINLAQSRKAINSVAFSNSLFPIKFHMPV